MKNAKRSSLSSGTLISQLKNRRKPQKWYVKLKNIFWRKRQTVFALYWWCKQRWFEFDAMAFALHHDNMPIKGFPIKYELQGGWTIPKKDLEHLYKGLLASEGLQTILVQHQLGWQRFVALFNQLKPLGTLIIFIGICIRYWPAITATYKEEQQHEKSHGISQNHGIRRLLRAAAGASAVSAS